MTESTGERLTASVESMLEGLDPQLHTDLLRYTHDDSFNANSGPPDRKAELEMTLDKYGEMQPKLYGSEPGILGYFGLVARGTKGSKIQHKGKPPETLLRAVLSKKSVFLSNSAWNEVCIYIAGIADKAVYMEFVIRLLLALDPGTVGSKNRFHPLKMVSKCLLLRGQELNKEFLRDAEREEIGFDSVMEVINILVKMLTLEVQQPEELQTLWEKLTEPCAKIIPYSAELNTEFGVFKDKMDRLHIRQMCPGLLRNYEARTTLAYGVKNVPTDEHVTRTIPDVIDETVKIYDMLENVDLDVTLANYCDEYSKKDGFDLAVLGKLPLASQLKALALLGVADEKRFRDPDIVDATRFTAAVYNYVPTGDKATDTTGDKATDTMVFWQTAKFQLLKLIGPSVLQKALCGYLLTLAVRFYHNGCSDPLVLIAVAENLLPDVDVMRQYLGRKCIQKLEYVTEGLNLTMPIAGCGENKETNILVTSENKQPKKYALVVLVPEGLNADRVMIVQSGPLKPGAEVKWGMKYTRGVPKTLKPVVNGKEVAKQKVEELFTKQGNAATGFRVHPETDQTVIRTPISIAEILRGYLQKNTLTESELLSIQNYVHVLITLQDDASALKEGTMSILIGLMSDLVDEFTQKYGDLKGLLGVPQRMTKLEVLIKAQFQYVTATKSDSQIAKDQEESKQGRPKKRKVAADQVEEEDQDKSKQRRSKKKKVTADQDQEGEEDRGPPTSMWALCARAKLANGKLFCEKQLPDAAELPTAADSLLALSKHAFP